MALKTFLVEAYAPGESDLATLREQGRRAAATQGAAPAMRHMHSILLGEDETCFHLFEAESIDVVTAAVAAAEIRANRIVEVTA